MFVHTDVILCVINLLKSLTTFQNVQAGHNFIHWNYHVNVFFVEHATYIRAQQ
jgi:hypothetical protein